MRKVLFICLGNVARSQMAEAWFNHLTKEGVAKSAGVLDFTPLKYGRPVDDVITVMNEIGIDVSGQKVKTVTPQMVEEADEVYVLCKKEECPVWLTDQTKIKYWSVDDPFSQGIDKFRKIRDQIKGEVELII